MDYALQTSCYSWICFTSSTSSASRCEASSLDIHVVRIAMTPSNWNNLFLVVGVLRITFSPEDDQSLLIETSSCTLSSFLELITTQLRFYMVSPQLVLLKNLLVNSTFRSVYALIIFWRMLVLEGLKKLGGGPLSLDLWACLCHYCRCSYYLHVQQIRNA